MSLSSDVFHADFDVKVPYATQRSIASHNVSKWNTFPLYCALPYLAQTSFTFPARSSFLHSFRSYLAASIQPLLSLSLLIYVAELSRTVINSLANLLFQLSASFYPIDFGIEEQAQHWQDG
jgi:hypothetical protein